MDPTREQIASALMSGAGQKMGPPGPENPMADYMGARTIGKAGRGVINSALGAAAVGPAFFDSDPFVSPWLARLLGASMFAGAADDFSQAGNFNDARHMWSNTGMPGRPVPDQQNPMLMLQKLNQMQGGDGN